MNKICKFLTLIILIVVVLLFGIYQYRTFIQTEIYQENSEHLLATYEQVNRTFTLFTQRNWNVLSDWDEYLQCISDSENTETVWHDFADRKNNWQYSDFYMFNEHCDFLTANNRKGTADSIQNCFQEMYSSGCPTISCLLSKLKTLDFTDFCPIFWYNDCKDFDKNKSFFLQFSYRF